MIGNTYFYNQTLRKTIAVFGSLFNNITVAKTISGKSQGIVRVPLSYGPAQKFLQRIASYDANNNLDVAIRLPRMSFEITSISLDQSAKLNRLNSEYVNDDNAQQPIRIWQAVPYTIGIQLNVIAKQQDDALQILEQIIPYFAPDYTVSIKDIEGPGTVTDCPISLQSVSMQDDYEGDFNTRRSIIYSLDFNMKIRFAGPMTNRASVIHSVDLSIHNHSSQELEHITTVNVEVNPPDPTITTTYGFDSDDDQML